jgi:hypothetical protein
MHLVTDMELIAFGWYCVTDDGDEINAVGDEVMEAQCIDGQWEAVKL